MKLTVLCIIIILLVYGLIFQSATTSILAAILYIILLLINLVSLFILSKKYSKNKLEEEVIPSKSDKIYKQICSLLEGCIVLFSLGATLDRNSFWGTVGGIVWFGSIIIWILSGFVIKVVAGVPVRMGYERWNKPKTKRYYKREK